nr:hypothetical protein GCM10010200_015760 [Actinomadura rugatobispora]
MTSHSLSEATIFVVSGFPPPASPPQAASRDTDTAATPVRTAEDGDMRMTSFSRGAGTSAA